MAQDISKKKILTLSTQSQAALTIQVLGGEETMFLLPVCR